MKSELTPKENLLRTINFSAAEYIPFEMESTWEIYHQDALFYKGNGDGHATNWIDTWGVRFERPDARLDGYPRFHPLRNFENMETYKWPDFHSPELLKEASRALEKIDRRKYLVMGMNPGFMFVRSWLLVGMNELLMGLVLYPGKVNYIMDRILEYQIGIAKKYIELGIDIVQFGDDAGTTKQLMMRPSLWRHLVRPRLKQVIDVYRNAGCLVLMHCCGCLTEIIEDIVDMGVDILNPIQAGANDLATLRRKTQGKVALYGGIDAHKVATGTPEQVSEITQKTLNILARNGGYIAAADQILPFPEENIEAIKETVRLFDVR